MTEDNKTDCDELSSRFQKKIILKIHRPHHTRSVLFNFFHFEIKDSIDCVGMGDIYLYLYSNLMFVHFVELFYLFVKLYRYNNL